MTNRLIHEFERALDFIAAWTMNRGGASTSWAAFASIAGVLIIFYMVSYLVFLRLRASYRVRRHERMLAVWRPIFIDLLTGVADIQSGADLPALKKNEREDLIQMISHFAVRIPHEQRQRLKTLSDAVGLSAYFLDELKSGNSWRRARAALMCGYAGLTESIPDLLKMLTDKDPLAVYDAARALGMLGDPRVIKDVVAVICRQDSWTRDKIAELLLEFGPSVAMETLRQFLSGNVAPNWLRPMVEIMGHFRVTEARPALEAAVRGDDEALSHAAIKALGRIGSPSSDWVLRACLTSPIPRIRHAAAEALGTCMATKAEQDLIDLLSDPDVSVRQAAGAALLAFGERGERKLWEVSRRTGKSNVARDTAAWVLQRASWTRAIRAA